MPVPRLIAVSSLLALAACQGPAAQENPLADRLAGKSCRVYDDAQGVPHARAEGDLEAYACFGYLHGRDRAAQVDFFRRLARGRTAELVGTRGIRTDFLMRMLGLPDHAQRVWSGLSPAHRDRLWAYAHGVSRGFRDAGPGASGYEDWHPVDTLALMLLQAFDQTRDTFARDLQEQEWRDAFGADAEALFARDGLPWDTTILKKGEYPRVKAVASRREPVLPSWRMGALSDDFGPRVGIGSNNWVLAPSRSATGKAWLANDPHLELKQPPFWHWSHVQSGEWQVIGAALPGVPLVVSGANERVAWGLTNSYLDVADAVGVPKEDLKDYSSHRPLIWFKLGPVRLPFFFKSYLRSPRGLPVLPVDSPEGKAVVLRWSGFELEGRDLDGIFELPRVRGAAEADRAFSRVGLPSWNFVFADVGGAVGYRAIGRVPRRETPPPFGVSQARAADLGTSWPALSAEEMPHVLAPVRGYVATANNRQWPSDSALSVGRAQIPAFRAFRIEELLLARARHDRESIRAIQCDVQAVDARFLLPRMLAQLPGGPDTKDAEAVELLSKWDFQAAPDCRACAVYRLWVSSVLDALGLDEGALYRRLERKKLDETLMSTLGKGLRDTVSELRKAFGGKLPPWRDVHVAPFEPLAGDELFDPARAIATPGDDHSVNPGSSRLHGGGLDHGHLKHVAGASQRLIVELTSPPTLHAVLAGPNRGGEGVAPASPGSPWEDWANCRLKRQEFPVDWARVPARDVTL